MRRLTVSLLFILFAILLCPAENTPKLNLPLISPFQVQKFDTVNQGFLSLDGMTQATAISIATDVLAASASEGDMYIVSTTRTALIAGFTNAIENPTGEFTGKENKLAYRLNGQWTFFTPNQGWLVFNQDDSFFYSFFTNFWSRAFGIKALGGISVSFSFQVKDSSDQVRISQSGLINGGRITLSGGDPAGQVSIVKSGLDLNTEGEKNYIRYYPVSSATRTAIISVTGALLFDGDTQNWYGYANNGWVKFVTSP